MDGIWYDFSAGAWFTHDGKPWTIQRTRWQFRAVAFWLGRVSDGEWGDDSAV